MSEVDHQCQKCAEFYVLRSECEPTAFCDTCAQSIIARLEEIVPAPPKAITWVTGTAILNAIQKELYNRSTEEPCE